MFACLGSKNVALKTPNRQAVRLAINNLTLDHSTLLPSYENWYIPDV